MTPLERIRRKAGMTQAELAERSGLSQASISFLETGEIQKPSWDTVFVLSQVLGVEPHKLFPVERAP